MLIIDPMHNMYMGTAKYILNNIWIKRCIITSSDLTTINKRILSWVIPPSLHIGCLPASIEHSSMFTAEQWMLWVNYYSINCLYGIILSDHLECWRHFVLASRLLCKRKLSKDDILMLYCYVSVVVMKLYMELLLSLPTFTCMLI